LNHWLLLSIYDFFPTCCTIPNDLKFFKHVANFTWEMNPKNHQQHGHFFIQIWACKVELLNFCKAKKKDLYQFKCYYLAIHAMEISEIFSTSFQTSLLQDPMVTYIKKCFFFKILVLVLKLAVLEHFRWKHSQGTLGVKNKSECQWNQFEALPLIKLMDSNNKNLCKCLFGYY